MKRRVSLQTRILTLIISLILFITFTLAGIYAYLEAEEVEEEMGDLALRVATTVSLIPAVRDAFSLENPSTVIQPLVQNIEEMVGAEFIVVGNRDSIRFSHPDEEKIGKEMVGGDNTRALNNGEYYSSIATGTLGPSLRGKAPIYNEQGDIIGVVSVGFLIQDIRTLILQKLLHTSFIVIIILAIGLTGGFLLARSIRKDTLGLEPHEISALYRERNAILLSIKEGIIAFDNHGTITMLNHSAKEILGITDDLMQESIHKVLPNLKMYDVLKERNKSEDVEMVLRDRVVIVHCTPIFEQNELVGIVASFRNKTEIQKMLDTIFEIRKYSEELRAQTHEFTNKLYVISGLLQLGHYQEAIQMIQAESSQHQMQNGIIFDQIYDRTVQAILLGKVSIASEKKITFIIDEHCSLQPLKHVDASHIITIIGNLIDNAFDAVMKQPTREVSFFITDVGQDVVIEVSDNGPGISDEDFNSLFVKGFSTKGGKDRGFGLHNLKSVIDLLKGDLEINNHPKQGVTFSVFLPNKHEKI